MADVAAAKPRRSAKAVIPSLKRESGDRLLEKIRNSTLQDAFDKPSFFSVEYRGEAAVCDILARKYQAGVEDLAPADSGCERFVLGPSACLHALRHCPDLAKIHAYVARNARASLDDRILAVYLLGTDSSDENRQQFVLATSGDILIRDASLALLRLDFAEARFNGEGLGQADDDVLLDWSFDQRFLDYMREISLLKYSRQGNIPLRHPFVDMVKSNGRHDAARAEACMGFFLDLAADGLSAAALLRLEQLAILMGLREDLFLRALTESAAKNIGKNELLTRLNNMLRGIGPDYACILYFALLELCAGCQNSPRCRDLLDILRRDKFAGKNFVAAASAFFEHQQKACANFENILRESASSGERLITLGQFSGCLDLELLNTGVKNHG